MGNSARGKRQQTADQTALNAFKKAKENEACAHVWGIQACMCHQSAFRMEFSTCPQFGSRTDLEASLINDSRRPTHPLKVVTNSSNFILISCKFCNILTSNGQNQTSNSHALKPFMSQTQKTKHFDSVLRNSWDMANWNFVTSTLWHHFLGHGQN